MNNKNTISGSSGDYEPPVSLGALEKELCIIFCEAKEEWEKCKKSGKSNCKKPSNIASDKAKAKAGKLNDAVGKKYPGHTGHSEKNYLTKLDDATRKIAGDAGRKIYSADAIKDRVMRKFRNEAFEAAAKKGAKMAAKAWMKLVPGLNIISTAYDIYDGVMTAKEIYDAAKSALSSLDASAAKIRPDFAIEGPDGALRDTYDFKFPGDSFDKNPGQKELYEHATGEKPKVIDDAKCKCDAKKKSGPVS